MHVLLFFRINYLQVISIYLIYVTIEHYFTMKPYRIIELMINKTQLIYLKSSLLSNGKILNILVNKGEYIKTTFEIG